MGPTNDPRNMSIKSRFHDLARRLVVGLLKERFFRCKRRWYLCQLVCCVTKLWGIKIQSKYGVGGLIWKLFWHILFAIVTVVAAATETNHEHHFKQIVSMATLLSSRACDLRDLIKIL